MLVVHVRSDRALDACAVGKGASHSMTRGDDGRSAWPHRARSRIGQCQRLSALRGRSDDRHRPHRQSDPRKHAEVEQLQEGGFAGQRSRRRRRERRREPRSALAVTLSTEPGEVHVRVQVTHIHLGSEDVVYVEVCSGNPLGTLGFGGSWQGMLGGDNEYLTCRDFYGGWPICDCIRIQHVTALDSTRGT
nr:hypothetical protein CFP56_32223 [Quercus suber]